MYKLLYACVFISLGKYLEVECLGHIISICLTFQETAKVVLQSQQQYSCFTSLPTPGMVSLGFFLGHFDGYGSGISLWF